MSKFDHLRGVPGSRNRLAAQVWEGARVGAEPAEVPEPDETGVSAELRATIEGHMAKYPDRHSAVLPALTEAKSPHFRPVKYSLFPPLGLATLAAYLREDDQVTLQDEHVETFDLSDTPDLVVIQVYITSAYRAYRLAEHYRRKGAYIAMGGLHVTSLPHEAARYAELARADAPDELEVIREELKNSAPKLQPAKSQLGAPR